MACLLGGVWVLTHQQRIIDQFAVWAYQPDAAITGYADRADLTDEGRFLFYASRPEVLPDDEFDQVCSAGRRGIRHPRLLPARPSAGSTSTT